MNVEPPPEPSRPGGRSAPRRLRLRRALAAVLCALALSVALPATARADSTAGGDIQVAQSLGDRELTFTLRRVTGLPGPLYVDVFTHRGAPAGTLRLSAVPTGVSADAAAGAAAGTTTSSSPVRLGSEPGSYGTELRVDRAGPWELVVDDGTRTARIPFTVPAQTTSPPELAAFGGFVAAGVLMLVTVVVAVRARRGTGTLVLTGGIAAALATAVTATLLSASLPAPPAPGRDVDATQDNAADPYAVVRPVGSEQSRPPAALELSPYTASAGKPGTLRLTLTDGATGLPADDVVVHDGALVHLLVIGPTGELWHVHPVRTAPGVYEVRLRLPAAGHYAVSAEFARRGGGVQQLRSATGLTVAGKTPGSTPDLPADRRPEGPGSRTVDGVPVRLSAPSPRAKTATTLDARIGDTAKLQPWLGMVGHMIVVGPLEKTDASSTDRMGEAAQDAAVWAHAHSMGAHMGADMGEDMSGGTGAEHDRGGHAAHGSGHGDHGADDAGGADDAAGDSGASHPMSGLMPLNGDSPADESVAAYGPDVSFVYAFPSPGYYRVWIQAERDNAVLTVPSLVYVAPAAGGTE